MTEKSSKRKKTTASAIGTNKERPKKRTRKMAFDTWFAKREKSRELTKWQRDEVFTFFRKQGLTGKEEKDLYDKTFRKF